MICIINYGSGNISAIENIYKITGINYFITSDPDDLEKTNKIILPGVGAFDNVMNRLKISGFLQKLEQLKEKKEIKILGICVGMQIFAESSQEGSQKGLGWIKGNIKKLDYSKNNISFPLPHMGWNNICIENNNNLLKNIDNNSEFYFLHSYYFDIENKNSILASSNYISKFPAIINYENLYGAQFHPEKSHDKGVSFLKNFALI